MIEHHHSGNRLSLAVEYPLSGTMVTLSGLVSDHRDHDVAGQTKDILAKIDQFLAERGTDKSRIISAMIWLPQIMDFDEMNAAWEAWVPSPPPARACVEARLADPRLKVEIQVHALK